MHKNFWLNKWENNKIGFHLDNPHPLLMRQINTLKITPLKLESESTLFIPLCGKTLDIAYLLNLGYSVIGSELSEIAVKQLFQELGLEPQVTKITNLLHYQARNIDIFVGDFFNLNTSVLAKVNRIDAIYDRAAFIALPLSMRQNYTRHLIEITQSAPQILISLMYKQEEMKGPPFSIDDIEIKNYYTKTYSRIQCVEQQHSDVKGKINAIEKTWVLCHSL